MASRILNYKSTCGIVGVLLILTSASIFLKGPANSMAAFGVPASILQSPHYQDAILWVYMHMTVIGMIILLLGYTVTDIAKQKDVAFVVFLILAIYTYQDFARYRFCLGQRVYTKAALPLSPL
jgi:hypothetical protein